MRSFFCQLSPFNPAHWFVAAATLTAPDVRGRWVPAQPGGDYLFEVFGELPVVVAAIRVGFDALPEWGWREDRRPAFFLPHCPKGTTWTSFRDQLANAAGSPLNVESVLLQRWIPTPTKTPCLRFNLAGYPPEAYEMGNNPESKYSTNADAEAVQMVGVSAMLDGAEEILGTYLPSQGPPELRYPIWLEPLTLAEVRSLYPAARGVDWWSARRRTVGKGGLKLESPKPIGLLFDPRPSFETWIREAFRDGTKKRELSLSGESRMLARLAFRLAAENRIRVEQPPDLDIGTEEEIDPAKGAAYERQLLARAVPAARLLTERLVGRDEAVAQYLLAELLKVPAEPVAEAQPA